MSIYICISRTTNETILEAQNCHSHIYIYIYTTLCSDLGNHHFQNAARGPLKYGAPGPARRILKMMISKKTKNGGDPSFT